MKAYLRKIKQEETQLKSERATGRELETKYTNKIKIKMLNSISCS